MERAFGGCNREKPGPIGTRACELGLGLGEIPCRLNGACRTKTINSGLTSAGQVLCSINPAVATAAAEAAKARADVYAFRFTRGNSCFLSRGLERFFISRGKVKLSPRARAKYILITLCEIKRFF